MLSAAEFWKNECLVSDGSVLSPGRSLWTLPLADEVSFRNTKKRQNSTKRQTVWNLYRGDLYDNPEQD
jgi:hypothetical protein